MEEYIEENVMEQEGPEIEVEADAAELFTDTVSGNDIGADTGTDGQEETLLEDSEQVGQEELLESLNALIEVLTPGEEDEAVEDGTEIETESLPSETDTAIQELLESIYAEIAAGRTADALYYEAWTECQTVSREKAETQFNYIITAKIVLLFTNVFIAGLLLAKIIWERFK